MAVAVVASALAMPRPVHAEAPGCTDDHLVFVALLSAGALQPNPGLGCGRRWHRGRRRLHRGRLRDDGRLELGGSRRSPAAPAPSRRSRLSAPATAGRWAKERLW